MTHGLQQRFQQFKENYPRPDTAEHRGSCAYCVQLGKSLAASEAVPLMEDMMRELKTRTICSCCVGDVECVFHAEKHAGLEAELAEVQRQLRRYQQSYKELCEESCAHEARADKLTAALEKAQSGLQRLADASSANAVLAKEQQAEIAALLKDVDEP